VDEGDRAARIIQDALGIESDDVVNCGVPLTVVLTPGRTSEGWILKGRSSAGRTSRCWT
jgi:hypothetical protein